MKQRIFLIVSFLVSLPMIILSQEKSTTTPTTTINHWKASLDVGAALYSGNVEKQDLRGLMRLIRNDEVLDFSLDVKSVLSTVDKKTKNKEHSATLKVDYLPENKIVPFVLFNAYQNIPKGYESRFGGLFGVKWVFFRGKKSDYSISAAYAFETEKFTNDAEGNSTKKSVSKLSVRPKIEQTISEFAVFDAVAFYVPELENFSDYRIDLDLSLTNKVTQYILTKFAYSMSYEKITPRPDIKNTDQAFVASIVLKF
jgi:hypothetical protein